MLPIGLHGGKPTVQVHTFPHFTRIDTRHGRTQVTDLVDVPDADKSAQGEQSPASEILERTVYTKTMKGNKMVRKLLLWKTNKTDRSDFPGYVVYLTDFSPNRQNPLERDIKISNNEKTARKFFDQMAEKNFISGWEEVK